MVITFCGHSNFVKAEEHEQKILDFLQEKVGNAPCDFYLGGYGAFDNFAYSCCKKYKENHSNVSLIFVSPYMTVEYQKNHLEYQKTRYDCIVYPEIENKPPKFAIYYRNRYMVEKADYILAFVKYDFGGAYQAYKYAKRKGKQIYNLAEFEKI